jgi:uncharacterized protein
MRSSAYSSRHKYCHNGGMPFADHRGSPVVSYRGPSSAIVASTRPPRPKRDVRSRDSRCSTAGALSSTMRSRGVRVRRGAGLIIVDTDGLYRALDASAPHHQGVRNVLESTDDPLILSPFVLAELDYVIRKRLGQHVQLELLFEIESGVYELQLFDSNDIAEARSIVKQQAALGISLADASIVVLARKLRTQHVLTFDGHFRKLQPDGSASFFVLLPADA